MEKEDRYIVQDARERECSWLKNEIRTPWRIVDTTTGKIVDEFASRRAAKETAQDMNAGLYGADGPEAARA